MNDWMNELKSGKNPNEGKEPDGTPGLSAGKGAHGAPPKISHFSGKFKFFIGEKVYSRMHEYQGVVEYSELTRYINCEQISYKIRFNTPEDMKTDWAMVDEEWLDRI